jgi:superfamily II DNA or RNA helicase
MLDALNKFEFVILEEAHESSADGWFEILKYCKSAYYRLALTATPFMRESEEANMRLMASSGPVAIKITEKELIDKGILAKPYFKFVTLTKNPPLLATSSDWRTAYRLGIVENEERNQKILFEVRRAVEHGLSVMVLFKMVEHGKRLKALFDANGIRSALISGSNDQEERKAAITQLKEGNIDVLL